MAHSPWSGSSMILPYLSRSRRWRGVQRSFLLPRDLKQRTVQNPNIPSRVPQVGPEDKPENQCGSEMVRKPKWIHMQPFIISALSWNSYSFAFPVGRLPVVLFVFFPNSQLESARQRSFSPIQMACFYHGGLFPCSVHVQKSDHFPSAGSGHQRDALWTWCRNSARCQPASGHLWGQGRRRPDDRRSGVMYMFQRIDIHICTRNFWYTDVFTRTYINVLM